MAKRLRLFADLLFFLLFSLVFVQVFLVMAKKCLPAALAFVPLSLLALFLLPRLSCAMTKGRLFRLFQGLSYTKLWILVQIPGILVLLVALKYNQITPSWDWGTTLSIALQYAESGDTTNPGYVAMYTNNHLWICCLTVFFKVLRKLFGGANLTRCLWFLCDFLVLGAANLVYLAARTLFSERKAFFCGVLMAFFLPIWLYAQITYTDPPGLFLTALLLYLFCRFRKSTGKARLVLLSLIGITAAIGFRMKVLVFILFLAIAIELVLSIRRSRQCLLGLLVLVLSLFGTFGLTGMLTARMLHVSEEITYDYQFPLTHWIMMGLTGNGGYNSSDYSETAHTLGYEEKVENTTAKIQERLEELGVSGLLYHVFWTKTRRTFGNCFLSVTSYLNRSDESNTFQELVSSDALFFLQSLYYGLLMLGVFASGLFTLIRKGQGEALSAIFVCRVALIGFFLFESIWECNSRYLLTLVPALVLVSADGWMQLASACLVPSRSTTIHNRFPFFR